MIEVQRLALLREVAHRGSFARAAQALRMTPSAVSQQMAALERAAGLRLFERSTRGVTLTPAGQVLARTADAVHGELHRAHRTLAHLRDQGPSSLTVATFPSAGTFLLAPALAALATPRAHHATDGDLHNGLPGDTDLLGSSPPGGTTVIESEPAQALAALGDGRADMALVYHFNTKRPPASWQDAVLRATYHPLVHDELRLLVPAGHRLASRRAARLEDVAGEPWIHGWDLPGDAIDALTSANGLTPQVVCRAGDFRFMQALVAAGVGIAFIPSLAVEDRDDTRALPVTPTATRYIGAYTAPGTPGTPSTSPTPPVRALLEALQERAAALRTRPGQGAPEKHPHP
ncbi:LysR family transcriptional regulator [Streptomyces sp. NPDC093085]|uniref:LysR family transcriptional regulator n=1 Tax=Streptomyces sp. NPDC093085 TaxID=3155068 RepID=UPI003426186C